MPSLNISPRVRFALYVVSALGSVVAAYLFARGIVGEAETGLWAGIVAIINAISASNVELRSGAYYNPEGGNRKILGKAAMSPLSPRKTEKGISDAAFVAGLALIAVIIVLLFVVR